ncbi:glycosyltransferase family 4 protein [Aureimonas pseudogalii]|nr:glycosyltransferase family 4 protein [Aureimonas pseudogalii]
MRIGLIAWDYPPSPSGLSTAAREIAESLAAAGMDVTVFALDRTGTARQGAVTVVGCAIPERSGLAFLRRRGGIGHLAAPLAFRRAVRAEHRRRPFDLVEATNWYAPAVLLGGRGDPPLVTRNSTPAAYSRERPTSLRDRFDAATADRLEARQAQRSAAFLSNTAEHARRIAAEYRLGADRRPHAVAGLSLPPETIRRGAIAPYPPLGTGDPVQLLFVGRAEHRKGFDLVTGAAAILGAEAEAGTLPPFAIRLVGVPAADLPATLSPLARARITPLGRLPEGELAREYEAAHVVLAPSRYESFGLVYQEAIAYGRPMVACAVDASGQLFVGDTGAGAMAASDTPEAMAEALRPLIRDANVRESFRAHALKAAGRFDRERLAAETLALYRQALLAAAPQGR